MTPQFPQCLPLGQKDISALVTWHPGHLAHSSCPTEKWPSSESTEKESSRIDLIRSACLHQLSSTELSGESAKFPSAKHPCHMERRLRWLLGILGDLLRILLCGDPDLESSTLCANWSGLFSHCYQPQKIVWPALQPTLSLAFKSTIFHFLLLRIRLGMRITVY